MCYGRFRREPTEMSNLPQKLRALGYASYDSYLKSPHWTRVKRRYRASKRPQRCFCGDPHYQLHHISYERISNERLTDLVALCDRCHSMLHQLVREGQANLNPNTLFSEARAVQYAESTAAMRERAQLENAQSMVAKRLDKHSRRSLAARQEEDPAKTAIRKRSKINNEKRARLQQLEQRLKISEAASADSTPGRPSL